MLGAVLLLAIVLRIPFLTGSFWLDEAAQALESARPWSQQFEIAEDFQPPLLHLLVKVALYGGTSEWWLRTIGAIIPGLLTILVTYQIGKQLVSEKVGAIAGLLLATSSWHIFYSQELRPYSLPTMWAVLSWWLLIPWLTTSAPKPPSKQEPFLPANQVLRFLALVIVTAAGLYSSFLYFLVVIPQLLSLSWGHRHKLYLALIAFCMGGALFVPWLPSFHEQLTVGGQLRQALPGWEDVVSLTQAKALFITMGKFIFGTQDLGLLSPHLIALAILFAALIFMFKDIVATKHLLQKRYFWKNQPLFIFALWLVVPILAAWIISFWIPILHPKRVLFCLPGWALLMATGWEYAQSKAKWGLLGLLLVFNVWGIASYYTNPLVQREDWRSLHSELIRDYPAAVSVAVFSFPQPFAPWRWYDNGSYPTLSTGTLHIESSDLRTQLKTIPDYQYVLVFDYLRDLSDPDDALIHAVESYGFVETDNRSRPLIGQVRIFARPSSILSSSPL
jgi:uncharacterized membrane protein